MAHDDDHGRQSYSDDEPSKPVPVMPNLPVMKTPVLPDHKIRALSFPQNLQDQDELQDIEAMGHRYDPKLIPMFERRAQATILEIFYDFWVVANLGVFMQVHAIKNPDALWSYIGYVSLVWFNWFLVGCFDVRYVTDSIFECIARTLHLGVVVGFAVVAPNYDPTKQNKGTWQCMSLILMVSRLVLVGEYLTILWHIRKFKVGKWPLIVCISFHFMAAMVYLGVSFRFRDGDNSKAYIAWYLLMGLEAILQLGLSLYSKVLSFNGTHMTERMTLFTMFVLGEGVMVIIDSVVTVVKNNGWTNSTIGVLVAGVGTVYFVFMLYNDWMVGFAGLTDWRQVLWTILHYPFHVFLLLFIKGSTAFMMWWEVTQQESTFMDKMWHSWDTLESDYVTSAQVVDSLNNTIQAIWKDFRPTWGTTYNNVDYYLDDILKINDSEWNVEGPYLSDETSERFGMDLQGLRRVVVNGLFACFKIDPIQEMFDDNELDGMTSLEIDDKAYYDTTDRFWLVFQYVFACAGMALITMTILYLIIPRKATPGHRKWFIIRTTIFFLLGIGLSLVTLLSLGWDKPDAIGDNYLYTPWLLPTLCIVFLFLLFLTHARQPPAAVVFSRLRNPLKKDDDHNGSRGSVGMSGVSAAPAYIGESHERSGNRGGGIGNKLRGLMVSNKKVGSPADYSQVHVSEMAMGSGASHHSAGSYHDQQQHHHQQQHDGSVAYDSHSWNAQQQYGTEYYGAGGYVAPPQQQHMGSNHQSEQACLQQQQPYQQQQQQQYPNQGY